MKKLPFFAGALESWRQSRQKYTEFQEEKFRAVTDRDSDITTLDAVPGVLFGPTKCSRFLFYSSTLSLQAFALPAADVQK